MAQYILEKIPPSMVIDSFGDSSQNGDIAGTLYLTNPVSQSEANSASATAHVHLGKLSEFSCHMHGCATIGLGSSVLGERVTDQTGFLVEFCDVPHSLVEHLRSQSVHLQVNRRVVCMPLFNCAIVQLINRAMCN